MSRDFLTPEQFAARTRRVSREAGQHADKRLQDLGDRIARQRAKRRQPTEAELRAMFEMGKP